MYRLFFVPLFLLSAPFCLRRKLRRDKNIPQWPHYLGFFPRISRTNERGTRKRIWIQAVSVGEVLAIGPLIKQLHNSANIEIILTTTTSTGYTEAKKRYEKIACAIGLFPIDFWPCSALAWSRIQPDVLILAESELWPEHILEHQKRVYLYFSSMLVCQIVRILGSSDLINSLISFLIELKKFIVRQKLITSALLT